MDASHWNGSDDRDSLTAMPPKLTVKKKESCGGQRTLPIHQWTHTGEHVLILKCVGVNGETSSDFLWPLTVGATVEAPDWNEKPSCGGGLHGWPWGLGIGSGRDPDWRAPWIVFAAAPADIVWIDGKVKARRGRVVFVGDWQAAIDYILPGQRAWIQSVAANAPRKSDAAYGAAGAINYRGAASATGNYGVAAATGARGKAAITGNYGAASATGDCGLAAATGYFGMVSATGNHGAASATDNYAVAAATGNHGVASAAGDYGAASATGDYGAASATGDWGAAAATGNYGVAAATGNHGAAAATTAGEHAVAAATGYRGVASATGYQSAAAATGDCGVASATGYRGVAAATGNHGVASAQGICSLAGVTTSGGRASSGPFGVIALAWWNHSRQRAEMRCARVGVGDGSDELLKANQSYCLNHSGAFVEVKEPKEP